MSESASQRDRTDAAGVVRTARGWSDRLRAGCAKAGRITSLSARLRRARLRGSSCSHLTSGHSFLMSGLTPSVSYYAKIQTHALAKGTAPTQLRGVTTGISRPDVAAVYGARFQPSGYSKSLGSVPAGIYWYEVLAHSTATGAWTIRTAQTYVDLPTAELTITRGGTGTGQVLGPRVLGS